MVSGILTYYQLDAQGDLFTKQIYIGPNLFTSGGTLWLGRWHITQEHITGIPLQPFFGSVDEVRIWTFVLDTVLVRQSFLAVVTGNLPTLSALWQFDEGLGRVVTNHIASSSNIYLPQVISSRPVWQFSYIREVFPSVVISATVQFRNNTFRSLASKLCFELIYDKRLQTQCGQQLDVAVPQFYYKACLFDIRSSGSLETAYVALSAYADYCQSVLHLPSWPAQLLCQQFPKRLPQEWIGTDCSFKCVFGNPDVQNASLCVCTRGYWGKDCASECPGGGNTPCNEHGNCDVKTGTCECALNWRGNNDCSNCTPGWTGSDCSVAVAVTQLPTCSAFLGGHFTNFDSAHFNFFGVGEFWFVRSARFSGQLRQVPCHNGETRCINAVAFSFISGWRLTFHAPYEETEGPVVWINGSVAEFSSTKLEISSEVFLEQTSSTTYVLSSVRKGLKFQLRVVERELVIVGHVNQSLCNGINALCGNCDGNRENDFNVTGGASLEEIWRVSTDDSLFFYNYGSYQEERVLTGGEYALKFKRVGVSTDLMPDVLNASVITTELLFKMLSVSKAGGVLFTYSKTLTLTVFIEVTLKVRIGLEIWDTGISPEMDTWNQVTLVYHNITGAIYFYHINSIGIVRQATRTMISGIFKRGESTISIGQWIPALETNTEEGDRLPGFVGLIDEIRFWNREFSLHDVKTSWKINVLSTARHIAILWKFNEGQSRVVHDLVSGVHLYIPSVRRAPRWIFSYVNIKILPVTTEITFHTNELRVKAETWCNQYIKTSPLSYSCGQLGSGTILFYVRACLRVIASSRQVSLGVNVVVAFADTCQLQLNVAVWPARQMCRYFVCLIIMVLTSFSL